MFVRAKQDFETPTNVFRAGQLGEVPDEQVDGLILEGLADVVPLEQAAKEIAEGKRIADRGIKPERAVSVK